MGESRKGVLLAVTALLAFVAAGCRGTTPEPVARAETPAAKEAAAAPAVVTPTPIPAPVPAPAVVRDDDPVVVDPGVDDSQSPMTLAETARVERERRARAGKPKTVINDKNLHTYASKGQITVAAKEKDKKASTATAPPAAETGKPLQPVRDEQYWRGRALEIRERWRRAADDIKKLEQRSTELRQKFYLETDTYSRDTQIKPQWDRALDKLRQARLDSDEAQKELAEFLEEGRVADVMPGWLREGEDDEPEPAPAKKTTQPAAESIEPPVMETPMIDPPPGIGGRR